MPGYQSKILDSPPAPPFVCAICQTNKTPEIEYFIDTGVWSEVEGVIYLCNRCFEPLVDLTEKFILEADHSKVVTMVHDEVQGQLAKLSLMEDQAEILYEKFGLRLGDLTKFRDLNNKLDSLNAAVGEVERRKIDREEREANELLEVQNRRFLIEQLDNQIAEKQMELDIFVSDSLTTKLEHIGRADLVDILLNNRMPEAVTGASNTDERETDGDIGEPIDAISVPSF